MAGTNRATINLPTEVSNMIIAGVQEQSAIMRLARQISLPGNGLTIPMITADPEAEWVDETGVKPVKNPGLDKKVMQGYTLAVIVPFSNQFKRDAGALYEEIKRRLPLALAKTFDNTVMGGTTAPGSNFDTFANVQAQALTKTTAYDSLVAAEVDIAEHDGLMNGIALAPKGKGVLLSAVDSNKRPLFINSVADGAIPQILGVPTYESRGVFVPSTGSGVAHVVGVAGDWTKAMYGVVQGISLTESSEATLTTSSGTINLFQQNMFAIRAEIEVGFRADLSVFNKLTVAP